MKFGRIGIADATGAILAHTLEIDEGVLKKGRQLSKVDVAAIARAGVPWVIAARLEAGDVGEDEAAGRLAQAAAGENVRAAPPFTGRANLFASCDGVAVVGAAGIEAFNGIDEALTIATVAPFERVREGQMLATIKVITFAAGERSVAKGEELARTATSGPSRGLISVAVFKTKTAGLILTELRQTKRSLLEKRRRVTQDRLKSLGSTLVDTIIVPHEPSAVAEAIARLAREGLDPILVFAASAIVDRGDVIPQALVEAGGVVEHLGLPVDPGNLAMLGRLGTSDVIGVPSCAASPNLNGFDWLLERRLAGLDIDARSIARMGVGGLLKEIASRPQPRSGKVVKTSQTGTSVAAIILAAGRGTRMQGAHKLTVPIDGIPMVRHAVLAALASRARPVIVVTGHEAHLVEAALARLEVTLIRNERYAEGLSTSLACGIAAMPDEAGGAVVMLGDMPRIKGADIDALITVFSPGDGRAIVVPTHAGQRGNPVLWGAEFFDRLKALEGDTGARALIAQLRDQVAEVDMETEAIFLDLDTQEAVKALPKV